MRVLILTLILLVPLSSNAFAMTNEVLYKWCKPYADRAFKVEENLDVKCLAYFTGALEYANHICYIMTDAAKNDTGSAFARSFFGASEDANSEALIQAYVNKMKNEPERWRYTPNAALREVFTKVAPCE